MNKFVFWFYRQLRDNNYVQSLTLVTLLLLYVLISVLSITFYGLLYGLDNFPVLAQSLAIPTILVLLAILFTTKATRFVGYLAAVLYTIHIYMVTLHGLPNTQQINMFWFAIMPGFLVFQGSIAVILLGEIFVGLVMLELQCRLHGVNTLVDAMELFAAQPELVMVVIFVQLFSLGCAFMLLFMMQVYEENHQRSQIDHLTGLYNRHVMELDGDYVFRQFQKTGEEFYIIFSDLDRFKEVNDLFGHDAGDMVLREVGERLQQVRVQYNQTGNSRMNVYRFGGDEFLFLLAPIPSLQELNEVLERIGEAIKEPYLLENHKVEVGCSLGVTKSSNKAAAFAELIHFADIVMYANKQEGKLNFQDSQSDEPLYQWQKKFDIYKDLQGALENDQLRLVYQPLYCASSMRLKGYEVLMRWDSVFDGEIMPEEFIAVAEATGIIQDLSLWTINSVLENLPKWLKDQPTLIFSINISPYQLRDESFLTRLKEIFADAENKKYLGNIEFEVTETAAITNNQLIKKILNEIREMGFSLSLDDYGQGNTSFMNLQQAAFQIIKLDKRLIWDSVADPANAEVVKAAVESAHSLGLKVTAEGIETEEHLKLALKLGCNILQGYLFSRPVAEQCMEKMPGVFSIYSNLRQGLLERKPQIDFFPDQPKIIPT